MSFDLPVNDRKGRDNRGDDPTEPMRKRVFTWASAGIRRRSMVSYHLKELAIANCPSDPRHILPPISPSHRWILDVGCGAGQTLIASHLDPDVKACGVDLDLAALSLGRDLSRQIWFACAKGERLPFRRDRFDLVICRVALPYMHIATALAEMRGVLKPHGDLWLVLHPSVMIVKGLMRGLFTVNLKKVAAELYGLVNGIVWHLFGKQLNFPFARFPRECFQTVKRMEKALRLAGFENINMRRDQFFVVTAQKAAR